jgi:large subunit ribosomal protein L10
MMGPRALSVRDVETLADVPPRDVLLARLAGGFQAPLVKAAGLFQAFTRNFAYGLKALIDTLPAETAAEPEAAAPVPEVAAPEDEAQAEAPEAEQTEQTETEQAETVQEGETN